MAANVVDGTDCVSNPSSLGNSPQYGLCFLSHILDSCLLFFCEGFSRLYSRYRLVLLLSFFALSLSGFNIRIILTS